MPTKTPAFKITSLTPELKSKWIKALRSGNYRQARGMLRKKTRYYNGLPVDAGFSYCCLGVICNLIDSSRWKLQSSDPVKNGGYDWGSVHTGTKQLPFLEDHVTKRLINLNDDGMSFSIIADWIEEYL